MSQDLKDYLLQKGVATSRTTPYHSIGNGQCERYNGIIWNAIRMKLASFNLPDKLWEMVLTDALHSIRSLLCTAINTTPHERFFSFQRRSSHGSSLPAWLSSPGPVFLRRFVRHSKQDPLVDQVELIDSNPTFATVKYADGRESTVSVRDLAPCVSTGQCPNDVDPRTEYVSEVPHIETSSKSTTKDNLEINIVEGNDVNDETQDTTPPPPTPVLRRSTRVSKPPVRLGFDD